MDGGAAGLGSAVGVVGDGIEDDFGGDLLPLGVERQIVVQRVKLSARGIGRAGAVGGGVPAQEAVPAPGKAIVRHSGRVADKDRSGRRFTLRAVGVIGDGAGFGDVVVHHTELLGRVEGDGGAAHLASGVYRQAQIPGSAGDGCDRAALVVHIVAVILAVVLEALVLGRAVVRDGLRLPGDQGGHGYHRVACPVVVHPLSMLVEAGDALDIVVPIARVHGEAAGSLVIFPDGIGYNLGIPRDV